MTGTDPAIDAADRAAVALGWVIPPGRGIPESSPHDLAVASVRVAFASIRELHKPTYYDGCNWCSHCTDMDDEGDLFMRPWPCDTARLIYTSEELNHD